jgi:hypothetical protein
VQRSRSPVEEVGDLCAPPIDAGGIDENQARDGFVRGSKSTRDF